MTTQGQESCFEWEGTNNHRLAAPLLVGKQVVCSAHNAKAVP